TPRRPAAPALAPPSHRSARYCCATAAARPQDTPGADVAAEATGPRAAGGADPRYGAVRAAGRPRLSSSSPCPEASASGRAPRFCDRRSRSAEPESADRLLARLGAHLPQDARDVRADGARRQDELVGDLRRRQAALEKLQHLPLAARQRRPRARRDDLPPARVAALE